MMVWLAGLWCTLLLLGLLSSVAGQEGKQKARCCCLFGLICPHDDKDRDRGRSFDRLLP